MSFSEARIKNDLENLTIPLKYQRHNKTVSFQLEIDTEIYKGLYDFVLDFPDEYPFKSPRLTCKTKIFHPNIDDEGHVCLKVLREGWMAAYDVNSIVVSILCMFYYLSGEDALNTEAGLLFEQDFQEFKKRAAFQ